MDGEGLEKENNKYDGSTKYQGGNQQQKTVTASPFYLQPDQYSNEKNYCSTMKQRWQELSIQFGSKFKSIQKFHIPDGENTLKKNAPGLYKVVMLWPPDPKKND